MDKKFIKEGLQSRKMILEVRRLGSCTATDIRIKRINKNRKSILDLDDYCLLNIIKYIISDCEISAKPQGQQMKYVNLVSFALAHENFEAVLKQYFNDLYQDLKFGFVTSMRSVRIDFYQLQTIAGKEGEAFWKLYADGFRKNDVITNVELLFEPKSFQPGFLDHFQMIKCALESKRSLQIVKITLKGYSLEDLNNFTHITHLYLDVRMSAEALVNVCKSNPELKNLEFMSTEIHGRLSDIAPYCHNLESLKFIPKTDVDGAEYEPLSQLPKLREMTIHGVYEKGLLLPMLEAIRKWRKTKTQSFIVNFTDELPPLSDVTIASLCSLGDLEMSLQESPATDINLRTSYHIANISEDSHPLEQTLASISLIEASLLINWRGLTIWECRTSDINISKLTSLAKLFSIKRLEIYIEDSLVSGVGNGEMQAPLAILLGSMVSDSSLALKSICIKESILDHFDTLELVKIKSIRFLYCSLSDWKTVSLLRELTNLQALNINIRTEFEKTSSEPLCNLLNICQVRGIIDCKDWHIAFGKNEPILGGMNGIKTLKILHAFKKGSLNELFAAFANKDLIAIQEVDILNLKKIHFEDVLKVAEIQTIKKLRLSLSDTNGIEKLAELTELKELTISHTEKGSLVKLFEQLASKESPSLQCLQFKSKDLSPEEITKVSKIESLMALELYGPVTEDCASLTELAKSNINELTITTYPPFSLHKLFAAFAKQIPTRLQKLKVSTKFLDQMELEELFRLRSLKTLHTWRLDSRNVSFLRKLENLENLTVSCIDVDFKLNLPNLKNLSIDTPIGLKECQRLAELESLESLTLSLRAFKGIHILADIQNLRELIVESTEASLSKVYQTFACLSLLKLKHLSAPIRSVEELNEITRIRSLKNLRLRCMNVFETLTDLGQLTELETLQIESYYDRSESEYKIETVLAILKSCRNLDFLVIEYTFFKEAQFMRDIHTLLKSIRDPALQRPLSLRVLEDRRAGYEVLMKVKYIDDAFLKVSAIYNNIY